jgi:hypothetical protein
MAMFDDNPVLKERLMAASAFAGIALFAVAAVDVMLTGGFDFAPGRTVTEREQPSAYVRVVDAAQYVSDRVRTISWDQPMFVGEAEAATTEDLAGANDGSADAMSGQPAPDQLYSDISALYEQSEPEEAYVEEPSYQDAPAYDEEPTYENEFSPEEAEKLASAYGNG